MELKSGFKQTEFGLVPDDWEICHIDSVCEIVAARDLIKTDYSPIHSQEYPFHIYSNTLVENGLYGYSKSYQYEPQKITVTARGDVGHAVYREAKFCAIGRLLVLSSRNSCNLIFVAEFINNYVGFALESTGVPQLTVPQISKYTIAIPPTKYEQDAIAGMLSDADSLIESLEQLLAKKRNLKQGAMQELLTGKKRLRGFDCEWRSIRLGSVLKFQVGFPFSSFFFNEEGRGVRLIKNRDLKSDDQMFYYSGEYESTFLIRNGDVLVGMDGEFLPCLWTKGRALLNQRVGKIVPLNGLDAAFSFYYLIAPLNEIEDVTSRTTVKHLSHGDIEEIERPLPSIEEQVAIAEVLSGMDEQITLLEKKLAKIRNIKQGMMQQLLTGMIRLI